MIKKHTKSYSTRMMCRLLKVSVSAYYAWLTRPLSKRELENKALSEKIEMIFKAEKSRAGSPRITQRLQA